MKAYITLDQLVKAGACHNQSELFFETFGRKVEITKKLCLAHSERFNFLWAGAVLLSKSYTKKFGRRQDTIFIKYFNRCDEATADQRAALTQRCDRKIAKLFAKLYIKQARSQSTTTEQDAYIKKDVAKARKIAKKYKCKTRWSAKRQSICVYNKRCSFAEDVSVMPTASSALDAIDWKSTYLVNHYNSAAEAMERMLFVAYEAGDV